MTNNVQQQKIPEIGTLLEVANEEFGNWLPQGSIVPGWDCSGDFEDALFGQNFSYKVGDKVVFMGLAVENDEGGDPIWFRVLLLDPARGEKTSAVCMPFLEDLFLLHFCKSFLPIPPTTQDDDEYSVLTFLSACSGEVVCCELLPQLWESTFERIQEEDE